MAAKTVGIDKNEEITSFSPYVRKFDQDSNTRALTANKEESNSPNNNS